MKRKTIVMQGRRATKVALALLIGASVMQSCKDDDLILTGQPSWLGNSIYERLQDEGNYKYSSRMRLRHCASGCKMRVTTSTPYV